MMFHKNKMGSIIRARGTIFELILYLDSRLGFCGLKYLYSGISVIDKRLPGNTKKWAIALFVGGQSAISRILGGEEAFQRIFAKEAWQKMMNTIEYTN